MRGGTCTCTVSVIQTREREFGTRNSLVGGTHKCTNVLMMQGMEVVDGG
jgi:hypothetical protein